MHSLGKPVGLWYGIDDAWLEWCATEECENYKLEDYKHFYEIDVSEANILRLTTVQEVLDFHDAYKSAPWFVAGFPERFGDYTVDWDAIRKKYDGVEIAPYQWKLRLELHWYYPWDVACGCVWRMRNVSSRKIPVSRRIISKYYKGKGTDPCPALNENSG